MKISLELYNTSVTVEKDSDDLTIYEMAEVLRSLLVAVGFHENSVLDILPDEHGGLRTEEG